MIRKIALSVAILAFGVAPALAASSHRYYVEHAPNSNKCSVVSKRPDGKAAMAVGGAYKTKALAESAMKSAAACM
ncbi:hypothetical protein [Rhizobium mesoamericanum]|uniref:Uncharacterized protein n=1 Tax=Rhizobium mesoamericanum STM3625 TaxID=1211777 RepID=K0PIS5_9HYPH|nr:hypothetical protein [Rhizobium mesoamericanum]MDQ0558864.1 hypothetical protein [Rhizobium mesoamericanum]CCM76421.1 conserved exported hypothetical protein [Rhizobium mesoamericanum STM3625]